MTTDMLALDLSPGANTLYWSVGHSKSTSTWKPEGPWSWSDFVFALGPHKPAGTKEVRPYVGGTLVNGERRANTVDRRFLLTLDADYADEDFLLDVATTITSPYLVHTTWRHTPDQPRYRLIVPLDRGVSPSEYVGLANAVMFRLGLDRFDRTTVQPERFMWGPSAPVGGPYVWAHANAGAPYLPVAEWLSGPGSAASGLNGHVHPKPLAGVATTVSGPHSVPEPTDEDRDRAEEILAAAVDDVIHLRERSTFSGRNDAVFHLLPLLLQFVGAGALDEDLVLDSLFGAAQVVPADEPYTRAEFDASVKSAQKYADINGPALPETTITKLAIADFEGIEVEREDDELWTASAQLKHIAQAADNIGCSRLALLAATITRVLVQIDPSVLLVGSQDGSVGSRAALNLGVVLVGSSGQGKTTIQEKSSELMPGTSRYEAKPSTGQGLIQAYLEWSESEEKYSIRHDPQKLFLFDEIDTLSATTADKTSTLLSEVRTMMTGGMTGTANATAIRQRHLPARSYNFQMMVNAQPSRTGVLLHDRDGGTPQRFIWAGVNDPTRAVHPKDRPPWPGPLEWNDAFTLAFELGESVVQIPQQVKEELLDYDYQVRLEGIEGGPLSRNSHKNLLRLKVAVGIAFLHESPAVEDHHMHLADLILSGSYAIQRECEVIMAKSEFASKVAKVRSDTRVIELVGDEKLDKLLENALKKLKAADDWVAWQALRPAHRDRATWEDPLWDALDADPGVEVSEEHHGAQARRKARWVR